jgi:hypothetical protein
MSSGATESLALNVINFSIIRRIPRVAGAKDGSAQEVKMADYALVVGIEQYMTTGINPVRFAEASPSSERSRRPAFAIEPEIFLIQKFFAVSNCSRQAPLELILSLKRRLAAWLQHLPKLSIQWSGLSQAEPNSLDDA